MMTAKYLTNPNSLHSRLYCVHSVLQEVFYQLAGKHGKECAIPDTEALGPEATSPSPAQWGGAGFTKLLIN